MTIPVPRDRELLSEASSALEEAVDRSGLAATADLRLRLLEGSAARVGGYSLDQFDLAVPDIGGGDALTSDATMDVTKRLAEAVLDCSIPAPLAIAALGDSDVNPVVRRRQGRYFTDSRLAMSLALDVQEQTTGAKSILDPSCGAGVLLVAIASRAGPNHAHRSHLIRNVLWGIDRDPHAVRAARAAISSLTNDLDAVAGLCHHLIVADSLAVGQRWWRSRSNAGFDVVVGNPPWEKLKVTRHEHALNGGHQRHYGDEYLRSEIDEVALQSDRQAALNYQALVNAEMTLQGSGESDLYKMFVELGAKLTSDSGVLAFLVPAGFIRNHGTRDLREWLFRTFDIDVQILDNRERYFGIDSRFKFVRLLAKRHSNRRRSISFCNYAGYMSSRWKAKTSFSELKRMQPNLEIPEVRDHADWELFTRLRHLHPDFGSAEAGWTPRFYREVDMTNDRSKFKSRASWPDDVPVIEGRMVHHHRVSAKRYVAGRGRRAEWETQFLFTAPLQPQWFIRRTNLRQAMQLRVDRQRAGFCDITGQTNERTVLAALIPEGAVCGNKVPTMDFSSYGQASAWVGIANSFAFDWLTRRLVTTTLNFFILRSLPIPLWNPVDEGLLAIAKATQALASVESDGGKEDLWSVARIRAKIEVESARLYGISVTDLDQIMCDFPQVDKAQEPLTGETTSSITRDLIVASGDTWASPCELERAQDRVMRAQAVGAVPFIPNEHARAYRRRA